MTDYSRTLTRLTKSEAFRAKADGPGTNLQGQAVTRHCREILAAHIAGDRTRRGRNMTVWRALKGMDDEFIAIQLLTAGITVSEANKLGTNWDGDKTYVQTALFIGSNLGHTRKLGAEVGAWGIELLLSLPAIFTLDDGILKLTANADDIMDEALARAVVHNALLSPLTEPPVPWTQVNRGGLPPGLWKEPLIRERHPLIESAARYAISGGQMDGVLEAINSLQAVPFAINEPVLDFILAEGPPPAPGTKPPVWQKKRFEKWAKAEARGTLFLGDMLIAKELADHERFWVPLNVDFRGRIYGIPHFNYGREDRVRALFLFADGEPIGRDGLLHLKAHVAKLANGNTWNPVEKPGDRKRADGIKWTDDNLQKLCGIGRAVLNRDDPKTLAWAKSKDWYQFLAACAELAQAIGDPSFETRLPLSFDATASGLQHMSAMTRDEVGGRYTNLGPGRDPEDFYKRVAFRVWEEMPNLAPEREAVFVTHMGNNLYDDDFLNPFDRGLVKTPAMSFFYGSRPGGFSKSKDGRWHAHGMTRQIIDELKDRGQPTDGAKDLAKTVYRVIGAVAPKARATLGFLRRLGFLLAKENKLLRWTTPLGLPVINVYFEADIKRMGISHRGRRRQFSFVVGDTTDVERHRAANAAAANFTHSVDACHLQMVAIEAAKEGIALATVHDCFAVRAPRAARLKEIIGEQFNHLHENNLLAEVLDSARAKLPKDAILPDPPERGTLKLEGIFNDNAFK